MKIDYREIAMKYRNGLLEKGKLVNLENPDRLTQDQMIALTENIFREVDKIDMQMGYPHHDTGLRRPASISEAEQHRLFVDFIDWYQIIKTPSQDILDYVLEKYPADKFPKILCVGDGESCHLGRKLAMRGYKVISVDPVARREFSGSGIGENGGSLKVLQKKFSKKSTDMIEWSDVIIGSKIPECVEDLVQINNRPTVFNISGNAEIYNMKFKGKPIKSSKQLIEELRKCDGVETRLGHENAIGENAIFFTGDGRIRNIED